MTSYRSGREPSPRVQECQRVDHVAQSQFRSHSLPSDANLVAVRTAYRPSMMPSPFYFQQIDVTRLKDCLGQFVQRVVLHMYGKPFVCGVEARSSCDGPALQDTVEFQGNQTV